jgi:hypothetical protein
MKNKSARTSRHAISHFNYHALHIADQILNFGVMSGFNCESNEMHHKDDKSDALELKRESTLKFNC